MARELEDQIPRASVYKDLPKGRKRAGWKKEFLQSIQKAAGDLGDISEEKILRTVREYCLGRKKLIGAAAAIAEALSTSLDSIACPLLKNNEM